MKTLQLLLLSCVALATSSLAQSPGQVELRKYQTGGGMISSWVTPENSKALGFDGSGNAAMLPVGGSTFAGLSDVGLTGLANLDLPQYNASTGKWNNIPRSTFALASDLAGYQPVSPVLDALSALSNASGVLTNNGSGTLSYLATAATGAGAADANKLLKLDAFGGAVLGGAVTIKGDGTSSGTFYLYDASNADFTTIRRNPASAGSGLLLTPEVTGGTLIGSNDVGTVTRTMLADSPTITNLYTANDNWTNPSPATPRRVFVRLVGGGGGGGSGRKGAALSVRGGGAGGGPGCLIEFWTLTTDLAATEAVVVGQGGAGGAAQTANSTNGNPGSAGADTTFGGCMAQNGNGGAGGTNSSATGGATVTSGNMIGLWILTSLAGATVAAGGTTGNNATSAPTVFIPTGGGAGAGIDAADATYGGGNGGAMGGAAYGTAVLGGTGGAASTNGGNGASARGTGTGGGGGGSNHTGNAGSGGNGGGFAAGGGGGGGATDDVGNSGAGGNGAPGYALIITY